ncbi:hypothetical protein N7474_011172 [Penicillium riverlandense]|uniref:uncharacterized protein n=1 Tax=Penicillium riverlandense TaxID=1903569 RepID=UPI0025472872|nr:uncharacterized protein N7474_011172 [Penicillium riverlandense]KAJ5805285.1 hypothetical protein N7474_011172 [Penicillium riverlandense]
MSNAEQEWKPRIRPQSTMAQAFSSALDSAFSLDSEVDDLSNSIDQKRYQMMIQSRQLEELQARIREAENRLKSRQSVQLGTNDSPEKIEEESTETATQQDKHESQHQEQQQQKQQQEEEGKENDS